MGVDHTYSEFVYSNLRFSSTYIYKTFAFLATRGVRCASLDRGTHPRPWTLLDSVLTGRNKIILFFMAEGVVVAWYGTELLSPGQWFKPRKCQACFVRHET